MATFQGSVCTIKDFGTFHSGLNTGVATFQGSRLEGVHSYIHNSNGHAQWFQRCLTHRARDVDVMDRCSLFVVLPDLT